MSNKRRYSMRTVLQKKSLEEKWPIRKIVLKDAERIGLLMERAYRGTIDDEGETTDQFIGDTRSTMEGKYGPYVSDASFYIEQDGNPISATMVTIWKGLPLLAFSVTEPAHQGKGLAKYLIQKTINAMMDLGYTQLELSVTEGNASAEYIYRKLGFEVLK